ncbi:diacylglycerol kinase [Sphingomonas bacterium]|uniref:diacylglycerol kinase n=1 Tax=Sphingomonas bacterium TaxID=1895847 RepID=UPI001575D959|nr:diacylglycerol kinase [Sphingomonas bacterium]
MKGRHWLHRMRFATAGLREGWRRERSFRAHGWFALGALAALLLLRPAPVWWALIALVAALVMGFELINSALEGLIDLLHPAIHPEIKVIKDMAAGAVLLMGMAAVAVAAALLVVAGPAVLARWGWR